MQSDLSKTHHATISWNEQGLPISNQFDDVYFSKGGGLDETRHVFLQQNQLEKRFSRLKPRQSFVIAETGFGTGLNFLATCQLWNQVRQCNGNSQNSRLHYIAVEKYPLSLPDMQRAMSLWPELKPWADALLAHYTGLHLSGFQFFQFKDNIDLTLIIDDAIDGLRHLQQSEHTALSAANFAGVDAWFLDGFAPSKNPDMWQPALFETLANLSHTNTTLGTFTTAGVVKKGLTNSGFSISKNPGFGHKREQLSAQYVPQPKPSLDSFNLSSRRSEEPIPWPVDFVNRHRVECHEQLPARIAIIGAGVAGCHTAAALAKRGIRVTVFDREARCAQGASGNPQGIVYGKLSKDNDGLAQFNLASLLFAQQHYAPFFADPEIGQACGVVQLATAPAAQKQLPLLHELFAHAQNFMRFLDYDEMQAVTGISFRSTSDSSQDNQSKTGIYFPRLGWLAPPKVCEALLSHPLIEFCGNMSLDCLDYITEEDQWSLTFRSGKRAQFSHVVIANANDCRLLPQTSHLPCKPIRGQVSVSPTAIIPELKAVICGEGYIAPANALGQQTFGATFCQSNLSLECTSLDHQENLSHIKKAAKGLNNIDDEVLLTLSGRAALRCTTTDYLPIVGPAPNERDFCETFALLGKNAHCSIPKTGPYLPGLFINVGHGSRGLAYSPLSAQILAAQMCQTPLPVSQDIATALNPARFLIRDLIRNKR
ncbi:bifunctional tRNA (5-methylaminomethyl-2-thiouridine)(34)-methyltransferase MnmD/FAD-dependent 5-carboxymethylaminomethyl-2-thiouridine(34) oxidoreductase MnmC [Aurantivibrio plasticivorans]